MDTSCITTKTKKKRKKRSQLAFGENEIFEGQIGTAACYILICIMILIAFICVLYNAHCVLKRVE